MRLSESDILPLRLGDSYHGPYQLPTMSASVKGGAMLGDGLEVVDDVLSVNVGSGLEISGGALSVEDKIAHGNARAFDTVADMQADTTLIVGMVCHTLGFNSAGDGDAAWYKVKSTGTANGTDVFAVGDGLYAHLIYYDNQTKRTYTVGSKVIEFTDSKFSSYQLENTYFADRTTLLNDAIYKVIQGACYNTSTEHVIVSYTDTSYAKGKLVECSLDLKTVYDTTSALDIGHSNSLTYNSDKDEIWVACGDSGANAQKIVVLDASDYSVKTTISMAFNPWAVAYDEKNKITYCSNYAKIAIIENDYSTIDTVNIDSFTTMFPNSSGQGGVCINGMFYIVWSEVSSGKGYLSSYDLETGHVCKYFELPVTRAMQEFEDAFITQNSLCVISGHQTVSTVNDVFSLSPNNSVYMQPTLFRCGNGMFITDNSDLNKFNAPGRFYCSSATRAATLSNYPKDLCGGNAGFTLMCIEVGADRLQQVLVSNLGTVCMRVSTDTGYTFTQWHKLHADTTDNVYELGTFIENNTDLNTMKTPGKYYTSSGTRAQTHVNYPYSVIGSYSGYSLIVAVLGFDHRSQMLLSNANKVVFRTSDNLNNNTWNAWVEMTN